MIFWGEKSLDYAEKWVSHHLENCNQCQLNTDHCVSKRDLIKSIEALSLFRDLKWIQILKSIKIKTWMSKGITIGKYMDD